MATKIRQNTSQKQMIRFKRKKRIRSRIEGTTGKTTSCRFFAQTSTFTCSWLMMSRDTLWLRHRTLEEELKEKVGGTIEGAKTLRQSGCQACFGEEDFAGGF